MSKIKTRDTVKDIKALDKAATAAERMKDAFVRTKDSAEQTQAPEHDSPSDYAIEKIKRTTEDAGREAAHQAEGMGGKAFHKARDVHRTRKEAKQAADGVKDTVDGVRESAQGMKDTADGVKKPVKGVKHKANDIKNATNGIKDMTKGIWEPVRGTGEAAKGAHKSASGVRDTAKTVQETSRSARTAADLPKELMKKRARDTAARRSGAHVWQAADAAARTTDRAIKTAETAEKTIRQAHSAEKSIKTVAKGTVKTAQKSIKTAEQTAKTTIKTTQQAAKAAQRTAQATAKAARAAAQAARATARATVRAVRIAVKATISAVKAIIAATKALVSAIAAGGGVTVAVILIICMAALLVCSVFGIFFSSEDGVSENGVTMKTVVSQINTEFAGELARIQRENPHDSCEIIANRALWKDILAVYAVRTNTDSDNPLDVITLDDEKIELLRTVFWDMNIIDYWIETIEHTSTTTNDDGTTDTDTWYEYILHITVTGKTASEMAEQYGFNDEQKELLEELLRPEYDELWASLLAGVPSGEGTGTISLGIYIWPSNDSDYITSFFGKRVHPISGEVHHHNGIDIGAAYGTEVLASADGTVTLAGWNGGYGNCVIIDHGDGNQTLYAHMSQLSVSAGQTVTQGQTVGFVGSTGTSTGPHLHFETFVNDSRVDPLLYFDNYNAAW